MSATGNINLTNPEAKQDRAESPPVPSASRRMRSVPGIAPRAAPTGAVLGGGTGSRLDPWHGLAVAARTARRALAAAALVLLLWLVARVTGLGLRGASPHLFEAIGLGLGLVILGTACGNRTALFLGMLLGVPGELPLPFALSAEPTILRRKARWLMAFLRQKPRGNNTPGAHLACGAIAVKRLIKRAALRREKSSSTLRVLERRRAILLRQRARASHLAFRKLCEGDARAAAFSRREQGITEALGRIDGELFRRRLEIQRAVVEAFLEAFEQAWSAAAAAGGRASDAVHHAVVAELHQPDGEPPALLPRGLVRGRRALAFEYGMFLGRIAMALLFVATSHVSLFLLSFLLFWLDLYVVEPVVFKLQAGAMNALVDVEGHKMGDCRRQIAALTGGSAVFRFPIFVPKFSSNPAATQLAAIIETAVRRSGVRPVRITPLSMKAGNQRTILELAEASPTELERSGTLLCAALRAELDANHARFPLEAELHRDDRTVSLVLTSDDQSIWALVGEDASQAFAYLWKNLRGLADSLSHLGPRFQPVFILASNSKDPDVIQYEIDHLAELQWWSNTHLHGQVGFLYLLRGGAWYSYNPRLRRFDAKDKDFLAAMPGVEAGLAAPENPLHAVLRGEHRDPQARPEDLARGLNRLLGDPRLYQRFDGFDFQALPAHRQPTVATHAALARCRAGQRMRSRELLELNRELLFTALPMRGAGAFFKKVGNDIAVHELLVAGKTRPTVYTDRRIHEHVQDATLPNYRMVWGDFARYTGLRGTNPQIHAAILAGRDLGVDSVPELAAIVDDKNSFAPGEIEKGLSTMLHPENRHIVIGAPRIEVTLPEDQGRTVSSAYVRGVRIAREIHNAADGLTKAGMFEHASAAFGKWFLRPRAYFAHYALEALNAAHALSHDFQQSYLVAGAAGRLGGFCEALYGPSRFEVSAVEPRASRSAAEEARGDAALVERDLGADPYPVPRRLVGGMFNEVPQGGE